MYPQSPESPLSPVALLPSVEVLNAVHKAELIASSAVTAPMLSESIQYRVAITLWPLTPWLVYKSAGGPPLYTMSATLQGFRVCALPSQGCLCCPPRCRPSISFCSHRYICLSKLPLLLSLYTMSGTILPSPFSSRLSPAISSPGSCPCHSHNRARPSLIPPSSRP